eukprot:TCONS_00023950-protein
MKILIIAFAIIFTIISFANAEYKRVCYYTNWAQYRNGVAYLPRDYEAGLCTHLIYSFGKVEMDQKTGFYRIKHIEWNDVSMGYAAITKWKTEDTKLKVLLAIGGWNHASKGFTEMVSTRDHRREFIRT